MGIPCAGESSPGDVIHIGITAATDALPSVELDVEPQVIVGNPPRTRIERARVCN